MLRADRSTRRASDGFILWQRILHEGSAFGIPGRIITLLGGLLPSTLMVTGLLMWLRKRRARRAEKVVSVAAVGSET